MLYDKYKSIHKDLNKSISKKQICKKVEISKIENLNRLDTEGNTASD